MSELIRMPNNIYEGLLSQLTPLIYGAWSSSYNNVSFSGNFYDYEDDKAKLKSELFQLCCLADNLNRYVIHYFESIYDRIKEAPMGSYVDPEFAVPIHKAFECLVAAEVNGYVVGGKGDGGVDVIDSNEDIIQCKSGNSHKRIARTIYEDLIQSCINKNKRRAVLAVTDAQFPDISDYSDLQNLAEEHGLNIKLKPWKHYGFTHPPSCAHTVDFATILQEFKDNLEILLIFLRQIQICIGKDRRISSDNDLTQCINSLKNLPDRFVRIESEIYDNLSRLQTAFEDDESMNPYEKAFMQGADGSYLDNDTNSEDADSDSDDPDNSDNNDDSEDSDNDDDSEDSDNDDDSEDSDNDDDSEDSDNDEIRKTDEDQDTI